MTEEKQSEFKAYTAKALLNFALIIEKATKSVKKFSVKVDPPSFLPSEKVSYHEAGHAVLCCVLPGNSTLLSMTCLGDGRSSGTIIYEPQNKTEHTKEELLNVIAMNLGGLAAETKQFGEHVSGGTTDLQEATRIANDMVVKLDHSSLPIMSYETENLPEVIKLQIHYEKAAIIEAAQKIADSTLKSHWPAVEAVVQLGLKQRDVSGNEIRATIKEAMPNAEIN